MDINQIIQIATTIVASVGGTGIIILGLSSWIGKIWADRIYIRANAKYEKEIEELKSRYNAEVEQWRVKMAERRDLLNSSLNALSSGYSSAHERILSSIDALWEKIVQVREFALPFLTVYAFLLPKHYESVHVSEIINIVPTMTEKEFVDPLSDIRKSIDNKRPFVGESLWRLYSIYCAFTMRLCWKIIRERSAGQIYEWSKDIDGTRDTHLFQMLQGVFTDSELRAIIEKDSSGVPQRIMNALEAKMLGEMNELIFGRRLINISIEEQQRIANLLEPILGSTEITAQENTA